MFKFSIQVRHPETSSIQQARKRKKKQVRAWGHEGVFRLVKLLKSQVLSTISMMTSNVNKFKYGKFQLVTYKTILSFKTHKFHTIFPRLICLNFRSSIFSRFRRREDFFHLPPVAKLFSNSTAESKNSSWNH